MNEEIRKLKKEIKELIIDTEKTRLRIHRNLKVINIIMVTIFIVIGVMVVTHFILGVEE